jgi:hypothetical protein
LIAQHIQNIPQSQKPPVSGVCAVDFKSDLGQAQSILPQYKQSPNIGYEPEKELNV